MRLRIGLSPSAALLLSLVIAPTAVGSNAAREGDAAAPWQGESGGGTSGQERSQAGPTRKDSSDAEVRQALAAVERADGYREVLQAVRQYEEIIADARMVQRLDEQLRDSALDANRRALLLLERHLSLDCRSRGATTAARLLSIRLIAGYALLAASPQQFADVLGKFSALAGEMNAETVREALDTPGNAWPAGLLPLMQQFARDWPRYGALAAATRMAEAARPAPGDSQSVSGHWRSTTIRFERSHDEHLVLHVDGTAETWTVTASDRTPKTQGRWSREGASLRLTWDNGGQRYQPFTFYEGQLVFPNIANRRQFWERID